MAAPKGNKIAAAESYFHNGFHHKAHLRVRLMTLT